MNRTIGPFLFFVIAVITSIFILRLGLPGSFLIDDTSNLEPARINDLSVANLTNTVFANGSGQLGRPVSILTFVLTDYFSGYRPAAYKHINTLLHALCAALIFWFLGRLFIALQKNGSTSVSPWWCGAIISGVWAIHPLHVSTVLYAVQRMTQLSMLFTVAALLTYTIARQQPTLKRGTSLCLLLVLFPAFAILGLLSKEDAALLPVYILILEYCVFRFRPQNDQTKRGIYTLVFVYCITPLALGLVYFITHIDSLLSDYAIRPFTLFERLATQCVVIWDYVRMFAVPRLSDMTLYHDGTEVRTFHDLSPWLGLAGIGITLGLALYLRNRCPAITLGILIFFGAHLLESTLLPLELMFEHRNYFASVGLTIIAVMLPAHLLAKRAFVPRHAALLLIPFMLLCISLTAVRASTWSSHSRLVITAAQEHPTSIRAQTEVANFWLEHGQMDNARAILRSALHVTQNKSAGLSLHLLSTYCYESAIPPETLRAARTSLQRNPVDAYAIDALHTLLERQRLNICPAIDPQSMLELTILAPKTERTRTRYRYTLHRITGVAAARADNWPIAIEQFRQAETYSSEVPPARAADATMKLCSAYLMTDQLDKARDTLDRLIEMNKSPLLNIDNDLQLYSKWLASEREKAR